MRLQCYIYIVTAGSIHVLLSHNAMLLQIPQIFRHSSFINKSKNTILYPIIPSHSSRAPTQIIPGKILDQCPISYYINFNGNVISRGEQTAYIAKSWIHCAFSSLLKRIFLHGKNLTTLNFMYYSNFSFHILAYRVPVGRHDDVINLCSIQQNPNLLNVFLKTSVYKVVIYVLFNYVKYFKHSMTLNICSSQIHISYILNQIPRFHGISLLPVHSIILFNSTKDVIVNHF